MAHVVEPREPTQTPAWRGHVAHAKHVAGPREPRRTLWWCLRGMRVVGLASDGPTGIVGPSNSIGVVTQMHKGAPPYIRAISLYFFLCGTNLFLSFSAEVVLHGVSDAMAIIQEH